VLALLFAPSSGKKIRDNLARSVGEGLNTGQEAMEPMLKRLEKEFSELRKSVEDRLKQT
jgi:gas vesicle protein